MLHLKFHTFSRATPWPSWWLSWKGQPLLYQTNPLTLLWHQYSQVYTHDKTLCSMVINTTDACVSIIPTGPHTTKFPPSKSMTYPDIVSTTHSSHYTKSTTVYKYRRNASDMVTFCQFLVYLDHTLPSFCRAHLPSCSDRVSCMSV